MYLMGAGPGDPDLLTRKAHRILQQSDVVIYDRLVSAEVLALANPFATLVYAGKTQGQQDDVQAQIYDAFLQYAKNCKTIVRLKSGDPAVFGRCGEELAFLNQHGIDAEVVPGISSALAAPALNGIPLTLRNVATSFTVIAGHRGKVSNRSIGPPIAASIPLSFSWAWRMARCYRRQPSPSGSSIARSRGFHRTS